MEDVIIVHFDTTAFEPLDLNTIERLLPSMELTLCESEFTFSTLDPDKVDHERMKEWHFKVEQTTVGKLVGTFQSPTRLYINMFEIHPDLRFKGFGKGCIDLFKKSYPNLKQLCGVAADDEDHCAYDFWRKKCKAIYEECVCCLSKDQCDWSTSEFKACIDSMSHFMIFNEYHPSNC